jgi:hypothetical protein
VQCSKKFRNRFADIPDRTGHPIHVDKEVDPLTLFLKMWSMEIVASIEKSSKDRLDLGKTNNSA